MARMWQYALVLLDRTEATAAEGCVLQRELHPMESDLLALAARARLGVYWWRRTSVGLHPTSGQRHVQGSCDCCLLLDACAADAGAAIFDGDAMWCGTVPVRCRTAVRHVPVARPKVRRQRLYKAILSIDHRTRCYARRCAPDHHQHTHTSEVKRGDRYDRGVWGVEGITR